MTDTMEPRLFDNEDEHDVIEAEVDEATESDMPNPEAFPNTPKVLLDNGDKAKIMLERIKELEAGIFRDEMTLHELSVLSPESQTGSETQARIEQGRILVASLATMYNENYGG